MTRPDPLQLDETGDQREAERQLVYDAYFDGYDAAIEAAKSWGWRRPHPSGFGYVLLAGALVTGLVVGFIFGTMNVEAAPRPAARVTPTVVPQAGSPESDLERQTEAPPPRAGTPAPQLTGVATWYCSAQSRCTRGHSPDDLVAAAGPEVRHALGPDWRGATVRACTAGRCVDVELADWCSCRDRRGRSTLLDLSSGAFQRLAPLHAGIVAVSVQLDPR